ncbi:ornithine carbamoyltransferase [Litorivicinus lipolyticus]|uniref:Ornithine carbamoyltransferase n=1 Tax=Litorivicinus lipolyticus TaxID=418701 RepID=A0A5Q2Q8D0_9GAMM|nr:ornithine carbamoyltransferase [Litorivicinus lipolyticus]QGG80378.1 ornithine carbamoyltransferase [Litorivicinus lipolyticus]
MKPAPKHFLRFNDLSAPEIRAVLRRAATLKTEQRSGTRHPTLAGKTLGMVFEKSSTRTRVSFEAGIFQLGGIGLFLSPRDTQLGRGEPVEDTARVFSEMIDLVMIRAYDHSMVETFAAYSSIPVINALTDDHHPCQILADIQCFEEHVGPIEGKTIAWVGDGNNMAASWMDAASLLNFNLVLCGPAGYDVSPELLAEHAANVRIERNPAAAVQGAHAVTTDVWASMGQENEQAKREADFAAYQVTEALLDQASDEVIFMHCLPAHRGEEISDTLLDDPRSRVFDEAGNRLHAQKALMEFLVLGERFPEPV